jgi:hypothetical protein
MHLEDLAAADPVGRSTIWRSKRPDGAAPDRECRTSCGGDQNDVVLHLEASISTSGWFSLLASS